MSAERQGLRIERISLFCLFCVLVPSPSLISHLSFSSYRSELQHHLSAISEDRRVSQPCIRWCSQCCTHLTHHPNNRGWPWAALPINHLTLASRKWLPFLCLPPPIFQSHPPIRVDPRRQRKPLLLLLPTRVEDSRPPFRMTASINLTEVITHHPLGAMSRLPTPSSSST